MLTRHAHCADIVRVFHGRAISDPVELGGRFDNRPIVGIAMFTAVIATLAVNIAANVVSPANDFANAFPRHIDFKRGGLITGVLGIAAGYNLAAISATLIGAAVALAGMFWDPLRPIYDFSWFVGFGLAGALYWAMMQGRVPPSAQPGIANADIAPPR